MNRLRYTRINRIEDLRQPAIAEEIAYPVATAQVVFSNIKLLQQDFPQLKTRALIKSDPSLGLISQKERRACVARYVNDWVLRNAGFISSEQIQQTRVNSTIKVRDAPVRVYRPPRYGRAFIREAEGGGLLDIKGVGVAAGVTPTCSDYASGLMPLGRALNEVANQLLLERIFCHAGAPYSTLPIYAVIDLGFDIRLHDRSDLWQPAGAYVRPAHLRRQSGRDLPLFGSREHFLFTQIEMLLRQYGVTSAASKVYSLRLTEGNVNLSYKGQRLQVHDAKLLMNFKNILRDPGTTVDFDAINIQTLAESENDTTLVDFGHYEVREKFTVPIVSTVADRPFMWGSASLPNESYFIQPNANLAIPTSKWGWITLPPEHLQQLSLPLSYNPIPRTELLGINMARSFRLGEKSGNCVYRHLIGHLNESTYHLSLNRH